MDIHIHFDINSIFMPRAKSIRSKGNPKYCLDVPGGNCNNKLKLIPYKCHNGPNQKFTYNRRTRRLRSLHTGKCVEVRKDEIIQNKCSRSKSQKWMRDKKSRWRNAATRKCIDVEGGKYENGRMIAYKCHDGPNQKFSA